jgi:hypothetical protein
MNLASKLMQTAALLACAPFIVLWGATMFALAAVASVAQSLCRVWK